MDRCFLEAAQEVMQRHGIASERALSIALKQNPNFISRIKTGVQSVPADVWDSFVHTYELQSLSFAPSGPRVKHETSLASMGTDSQNENLLQKENEFLRLQILDKVRIIELLETQVQMLKSQAGN